MSENEDNRKKAIAYWEKRRIFYNLALVLPAFFGYQDAVAFAESNGDRLPPSPPPILIITVQLAMYAVLANICFSFAYALEFLLGRKGPSSAVWTSGRTIIFILGTLFAMVLAFGGGGSIAIYLSSLRQ